MPLAFPGREAMKIQNTKFQSNDTVEVLYQKMGDRWFAFSLVGEDVFVGSVSQDEIDQAGFKDCEPARPQSKMPEA